MEHLIKFRKLCASLTSVEIDEFLNDTSFNGLTKIWKIMMSRDKIIAMLFDMFKTAFQSAENMSQIKDVLVPNVVNINKRLASIIRSKKDKNTETKSAKSVWTLEQLPNESMSHISSFLSTSQSTKFERCSRTLFIAVRSVPLLPNEVRLHPLIEHRDCICYEPCHIWRWVRIYGARSISLSCWNIHLLRLPFFRRFFPNLVSLTITAGSYDFEDNDTMKTLLNLGAIELQSYESMLKNVEKLCVSEHILPVIGYKYFKSLRSLDVHCWHIESHNYEKPNDDWLEYLIKENAETLSNIEYVHLADFERQHEVGKEYITKLITVIHDQCKKYPQWAQNVLNSVTIRIYGIDFSFCDELKAAIIPLMQILKERHVSICFEFGIAWMGPFYGEYELKGASSAFEVDLQKFQNMFPSWKVRDELSKNSVRMIHLQMNDQMMRKQKLITDYFSSK